jgi:hypothetical protein
MGMRRIVLLLASMALTVVFGSGVSLADAPTTKEDCKNGGYAKYGFKNQGRCIKAVVVEPPPPEDTTPPEIILHNECPARTGVQTASSSTQCLFSSNETVEFSCSFGEWPNESAFFEPCSAPGEPMFGYYNFDVSQHEGEKLELTVRAVDSAGNVSERTMIWTVDTVFPTVEITSGPEAGATVSTGTVSFGWEASDNQEVAEVQCYLQDSRGELIYVDGSTGPEDYLCGGSSYTGESRNPATFSNLVNGEYTFRVLAADKAGQLVWAERTFTVNTTP